VFPAALCVLAACLCVSRQATCAASVAEAGVAGALEAAHAGRIEQALVLAHEALGYNRSAASRLHLGEQSEAVNPSGAERRSRGAVVTEGRTAARERRDLRFLFLEHAGAVEKALGDRDAGVRAAAAWAAGWTGLATATDALAGLLADEAPAVRAAAACSLGALAAPGSGERLDASRSGSVRAPAVAAEAESNGYARGATEVADRLLAAAKDADPSVRAAALDGMRLAGRPCLAAPFLADEAPQVRLAAAVLVAEVGAAEAEAATEIVGALRHGLGDASNDVRAASAAALGRLRAAAAVEALLGASRDADANVSAAAVRALGGIGGDAAASALADLALGVPPVAVQAVEAMGQAGVRSNEAIAALAGLVERAPVEVASAAAGSLAELGGERARAVLRRAARSSRSALHPPVALAAARLGEHGPVQVLLRDLDETHAWTRLRAARALARMGNPAGFPVFIDALSSPDERVRAYAGACLTLYSGADIDPWTDGPPRARARLAETWRSWWLENRETFAIQAD